MQVFDIVGISSIDYLDAYKKFTYVNRESYSLNHIAYAELGEKKLDYEEAATLHELYKTNFQRYLDYNVHWHIWPSVTLMMYSLLLKCGIVLSTIIWENRRL